MSRVFAAYSAGGLIGPALGAFGGIRGPFLAYLAMLLFAMPLVLFVKPAVHRDLTGDRAVLHTRAFWVASGAILFASLALGVLEGVLPLHLAERVTQAQIGALYVGASLVVAISATASGGRPPRTLVIAAVVLSVAASHLHPGITATSASVTGVATGITGTAAATACPFVPFVPGLPLSGGNAAAA